MSTPTSREGDMMCRETIFRVSGQSSRTPRRKWIPSRWTATAFSKCNGYRVIQGRLLVGPGPGVPILQACGAFSVALQEMLSSLAHHPAYGSRGHVTKEDKGQRCTVCNQAINSAERLYEFAVPTLSGHSYYCLHFACHQAWIGCQSIA